VAEVNARMDSWRKMGYKIALWRDGYSPVLNCDKQFFGNYPGYAQAVNRLVAHVLSEDAECDWCVLGGDDTDPDSNLRADGIAAQLREYFVELESARAWVDRGAGCIDQIRAPTFGVMQPTGDDWSDHQGRIIERIAGSAWVGREWCQRINRGQGPLWPEYSHCFSDEELQCVAIKLGVFLQRPDLTHMHHNWARARADVTDMPDFLREANSAEHWRKYSALFQERKAAGFPGSEPL
jgi:hypothetical protein